jgi:flagellar motor switch protein FliN
MAAFTPGTPPYAFLDAVRKAASEVFSQAFGANWSVEIDSNDVASSAETSVLCFQLSISGGLQGNACIQIGTPSALLLAQKFLAEAVDPSADLNQDRKQALEKLLGQVAGRAAAAISILFGEAEISVGIIEPPAGQGTDVALLASEASSGKLTLDLRLSPELLASISSAKPSEAPLNPAASADASSAAVPHEPNLDLLLGVNLNLTLRFGQRALPLREILDLNAGAIIELDREVQEPADLLLGNKVIARGQVVIVDGNYGLRVTEVTDARQRIGTL